MADAPATTTTVTTTTVADPKTQLLAILQNLPTAPTSGFGTSEFVMFIAMAFAIIAVGLTPMFIPATASLGIWFGVFAVIGLATMGITYGALRFGLKQSNINLLSLGVTAYRDVQIAAADFKTPAQLPDVPAAIAAVAPPLTLTSTTTDAVGAVSSQTTISASTAPVAAGVTPVAVTVPAATA